MRQNQRTYSSGRPPTTGIHPTRRIDVATIAIDAYERRDVATCDVEGAYLHADMDELVIMVVEGNMVDYLVQANPER